MSPRRCSPALAYAFAASLALCVVPIIHAQSEHAAYAADTWGADRGLPDDVVTAIVQTRDDFLWVGTEQGLARFDGVRFSTFRSKDVPALSSDSITVLREDRVGTLWIGTRSGLARRTAAGQFEAVDLPRDTITAMSEDLAGNIWVGTRDHGVFRIGNGERVSFAADPALAGRHVSAVFCDAAGIVWLGFRDSAGAARLRDGHFEKVPMAGTPPKEITSFAESPVGVRWIGSSDGLFEIDREGIARSAGAKGSGAEAISTLYADPDGSLWIGGGELQRIFHADVGDIDKVAPMRAKSVAAMCKDREGNLWVCSTTEGLLRIREPRFRQFSFGARNTETGIRTVTQASDGSILIAQGASGIAKIDALGKRSITPARSADNKDEVLAVLVTRDGTQFTCTRGELIITRNGHSESHPEVAGVRAIFEDRSGTVWLGFQYAGIMQWRDGNFSRVPLPESLVDCSPQTFSETSGGEMYVGTWKHNVLRLAREQITTYDRAAGAPGGELRNVFVDRADHVWVGSRGSGLGLLDGEHLVFPQWTSDVFDQQILGLGEDDLGNLWLSTPRAIFMTPAADLVRAMRGELPISRLKFVNVTDGGSYTAIDLQCFPNVWNDREGRIWFATKNRAIVVNPRTVIPNPVPPTVHIDRVLANGRALALTSGGEIELEAGTRELLIEYTGLSFSAPNRMRFQHRLEGFDSEWVPGDWRFAYYTNLRPGKYRFQVTAGNSDGIWNNSGASISFVQKPHIYETWWAWAITVVAFGASAAGAYRWRVAKLEREKRRLEARIAERTQELRIAKEQAEAATQAKTEFLESISHEIRNPLNGIVGLVAMLRESSRDDEERDLARSLGACAKGLSRVFDEVLNFSKLEHGHIAVHEHPFVLGTLVDDVVALFQVIAREKGGAISVQREGVAIDHFIGDEEKIGTVLGNFLSNAIKHAPGSLIEVSVQCDSTNDYGANVTLTITDHGPGIPAEEQELIFGKFARGSRAKERRAPGTGLGLATCRAIAELLGGHVLVESEPGRGASFIVTLRLKRDRTPKLENARAPAPIAEPAEFALVVEDQPYNQIVVRRIAEKLGFAVEIAQNAREAFAKFEQRDYAVVLLDWELPDANGDEVARHIRRHPAGRDVILIATTAHDHEDIRRQCTAAGIDDFALKPFEISTMARLLTAARARRNDDLDARPVHLDTRVFRLVGKSEPHGSDPAAEHYVEILDREIATLDDAIAREDFSAAGKIAHRLKAHAGLVDAADLRGTAEQLQRAARDGSVGKIPALHSRLSAQASRLRERLNRWRHPAAVG